MVTIPHQSTSTVHEHHHHHEAESNESNRVAVLLMGLWRSRKLRRLCQLQRAGTKPFDRQVRPRTDLDLSCDRQIAGNIRPS